jgi:hypothetical protein
MKKLQIIIAFVFIGTFSTSLSQNVIEKTKIDDYLNHGNWEKSSTGNIGIGTISQNTGELVIRAERYWYDFLRLIPGGQTDFGYWLFHNPRNEDKLHIGWHSINPSKEYWNLSLTQDAKVGINDIEPDANLTVNGSIHFHNGENNYVNIKENKLIFGSDQFNITAAFNGKIWANEIEVSTESWSDYVFKDDYLLIPIKDVETFIKANKHLPGVPSEKEVTDKGINLGEMDAILLKKIEELTLYVIELKKELEEVKQQQAQTK